MIIQTFILLEANRLTFIKNSFLHQLISMLVQDEVIYQKSILYYMGKFKFVKILTAMNISLHQDSELLPKSYTETPVKKGSQEKQSDLKTAESPSQTRLSIKDIDPQELFQRFNEIVTVTSSSSPEKETESPYRKLTFEGSEVKLNFDQSTHSMKKIASQKVNLLKSHVIKPFLFSRVTEVDCDCPLNLETDSFSPKMTSKEFKDAASTPPKKYQRSAELEKAAYKQDPFRDLPPRNL